MINLHDFGIRGNFGPLWRPQTLAFQAWALERLISFNCAFGDVRWAIMLLALRSLIAGWAFGQRQFVQLVRNVAGRAGQGAFAAEIADADSMVAAGGS
jgi:hypothetical protein